MSKLKNDWKKFDDLVSSGNCQIGNFLKIIVVKDSEGLASRWNRYDNLSRIKEVVVVAKKNGFEYYDILSVINEINCSDIRSIILDHRTPTNNQQPLIAALKEMGRVRLLSKSIPEVLNLPQYESFS